MKYTVLTSPHAESNMHPIRLDEGPFKGCELIYGKITFDDAQEGLLHFDYEIVNDFVTSKDQMEDFVHTIGDLLIQLIDESLAKEEVIYTGGVDDKKD